MRKTSIAFLIIILLGINSCKDDLPVVPPDIPPDIPDYRQINLFLEDVSCNEAWIKLSADSISLPAEIIFSCGDKTRTISLLQRDSVLYIDSLQKGSMYEAAAIYQEDSVVTRKLFFNTLNTTSSSFISETFIFGTALTNPSWFNDVTIINENDIWLAGQIYMRDSLGSNAVYGAAHWDGNNWTLLKVSFRLSPSEALPWPRSLQSIINFGPNAVYATGGANLLKWNGKDWEEKIVDYGPNINKLWGTDENNIYGAGSGGKVYKGVGNKWVELPQLTTIKLFDIYGTPDGKKIWACGWHYDMTKSILIEYEEDKGKILWERERGLPLLEPQYCSSLWATKNKLYVAGGRHIFEKTLNSDTLKFLKWINYWPYSIKGDNYNNIFAVGDMGMIWHFDGEEWRLINVNTYSSTFLRVAAKGSIVVAVGGTSENFPERGFVYMGKH
jgi:hypothetical protein